MQSDANGDGRVSLPPHCFVDTAETRIETEPAAKTTSKSDAQTVDKPKVKSQEKAEVKSAAKPVAKRPLAKILASGPHPRPSPEAKTNTGHTEVPVDMPCVLCSCVNLKLCSHPLAASALLCLVVLATSGTRNMASSEATPLSAKRLGR